MAQSATANHCNHSGCYCKLYVIPTSKWSKGKCKSCDHSKKEHAELQTDVSFDSNEVAAAPKSNSKYDAQIDGKMGIVPSGKTNYKETGYSSQSQSKQSSIYSISL
eukprot:142749_1